MFYRIDQNRLRLGHGGFSRLVHAGFQLRDLIAHAEHFQLVGHFAQLAWQTNLHLWVVAETTGYAQLFHGNLRALGQCILEAAAGVSLGQVAK